MLPNPYHRIQVLLVILLPVIPNKFIPFLKYTNIIRKFLIFCPSINNLYGIQRFWEKFDQSVHYLSFCWSHWKILLTCLIGVTIAYRSLCFINEIVLDWSLGRVLGCFWVLLLDNKASFKIKKHKIIFKLPKQCLLFLKINVLNLLVVNPHF